MMKGYRCLSLLLLAISSAASLQAGFRPPSVPLVVNNPYTSIWSNYDKLTDGYTTHWSGGIMCMMGGLRVDGVSYRWMGPGSESGLNAPAMIQVSVEVHAFRTVYEFTTPQTDVLLTVTFFTPAFPDDLEAWSLPISYITHSLRSLDGQEHDVELYFDHTAELAVELATQNVTWAKVQDDKDDITYTKVGTQAQNVLGISGDYMKIDWGYQYSATRTPSSSTQSSQMQLNVTTAEAQLCRDSFVAGKPQPAVDNNKPRPAMDHWIVMAFQWAFSLSSDGIATNVTQVLAYDQIKSMKYFGTDFEPYWHHYLSPDIEILLKYALENYGKLLNQALVRETGLEAKQVAAGGESMNTLNSLIYRQVTGSCIVVWNHVKQTPWIFMKEISSDGDVSTVDVIFPAAPFFLYNAPQQIPLLLEPLMEYANNATDIHYNLSWAPHHLGVWPICDIKPMQQEQMPMEESGNMLILIAGYAQQMRAIMQLSKEERLQRPPFFHSNHQHTDPLEWLKPYWGLLQTWTEYLIGGLPDPANQLCTDDFEGPSPHNVNLAAKGCVGLGAYALLLDMTNDSVNATKYYKQAQVFVQDWISMANPNGTSDHYWMQFNLPNSWSFKYNAFWQKTLTWNSPSTGLPLFPEQVFVTEMSYYYTKLDTYGIPMDDRHAYTKTDYSSWVAAIGTDEQRDIMWDLLLKWAGTTSSRVPLTDWYDTGSGLQKGFQARPVLGALFFKLLLDEVNTQIISG